MYLRIQEGMIARPRKDNNGYMQHPLIILSIPRVPYKACEFVQTMGLTSMEGKEVTTEIPIMTGNRKSYLVPYAVHSYNFNDIPSENIECYGVPHFMSWVEFKRFLINQYNAYMLPADEQIVERARKEREEYIKNFNEFYGEDVPEFRQSRLLNFTVTKEQCARSDKKVELIYQYPNPIKKNEPTDKSEPVSDEVDLAYMLINENLTESEQYAQMVELFKKHGITKGKIQKWSPNIVYTFLTFYSKHGAQRMSENLGIRIGIIYNISTESRKRGERLRMKMPNRASVKGE